MGDNALTAPLYVAWEVTHLCNAECAHCYSTSGPKADRSNELDTAEAIRVIDQLADAGVLILALSGGEPMTRDDWPDLVRHAKERGLRVNLGTNGALVNEARIGLMRRAGVDSVTVSIDSHRASVHDAFRRHDGLFDKAVTAVKALRAVGIRTVVGFTPTAVNWRDGPDVVRLAEELDADAVNLSEYVPAGRGGLDLAVGPEELHGVLQDWIAMRSTLRGRIDVIWHDCRVATLVPGEERRNYLGCGAGRLVARILPDGRVTPCVFLPTVIGSLRERRFADLWADSDLLRAFRRRRGLLGGNCSDCEHIDSCGGCRAVAYAYSDGDPLAGDPHCWIVDGRAPGSAEAMVAAEQLPV